MDMSYLIAILRKNASVPGFWQGFFLFFFVLPIINNEMQFELERNVCSLDQYLIHIYLRPLGPKRRRNAMKNKNK